LRGGVGFAPAIVGARSLKARPTNRTMTTQLQPNRAGLAVPTAFTHNFALTCHPESHRAAVRGVSAVLRGAAGGAVAIGFVLRADLARIRISPGTWGTRADGLWQHTCFEVFLAPREAAGYREFNFTPAGEWAAYPFHRYRERAAPLDLAAPELAVRTSDASIELDVVLRREHFPSRHPGGGWRIGLSAVVEDDAGALTYWALNHAPGKPDFHHPDAFAVDLASCHDRGAHFPAGRTPA
jgi:hypothetical protein